MSNENLEPCCDCGGLNISRRPYKYDDQFGELFECTCRDCGAEWLEDVEDSDG